MTTALLATLLLSVSLTTGFLVPSKSVAKKIGRTLNASSSSTSSKNDSFLSSVSVFDSVFSQDVCIELDILAAEHAERGNDGSSIFHRRGSALLTPLERALDSYLQHVEDPNAIVEYWSRQEFLNMDAHSDIDERALQNDGVLLCPEWGHVLYLNVDDTLRGPTCVFSKFGGWQGDSSAVTMVVVPAVQGRVLRFPGSAMHAIPRPCNRWLFNKEEERLLREAEEEDMYDDDDDDHCDGNDRSVMLFNTWPRQGPRGVLPDYTTGTLPDGIEIDGDDNGNDYQEQQQAQRVTEWHADYGVDCKDIWCHDSENWKGVSIADHINVEPTQETTALRVSLMGNRKRRLHPKTYISLTGPPTIAVALEAASQTAVFQLQEINK
jgi:hypothetical protein